MPEFEMPEIANNAVGTLQTYWPYIWGGLTTLLLVLGWIRVRMAFWRKEAVTRVRVLYLHVVPTVRGNTVCATEKWSGALKEIITTFELLVSMMVGWARATRKQTHPFLLLPRDHAPTILGDTAAVVVKQFEDVPEAKGRLSRETKVFAWYYDAVRPTIRKQYVLVMNERDFEGIDRLENLVFEDDETRMFFEDMRTLRRLQATAPGTVQMGSFHHTILDQS